MQEVVAPGRAATWLHWTFQQLADVQREIYSAFAGRIGTFAETGDWSQLAVFLPMGIVFGAVHALTPGHSKLVLAIYIAGSPAKARQALTVSILLSTVHVSMAVIIALFSLPLVSSVLTSAGRAPLIEDVSRGLLGLIGLWMLWQAVRPLPGRLHLHRRNTAFGLLAGLIPCPLTLFVMTFAMAHQVTEAGMAFAGVMMLGVTATLSAVALAAMLFREALMNLLERRPRRVAFAARTLQGLTGILLAVIAANVLLS